MVWETKTCPSNQGKLCDTTDCAWWNHLDDECGMSTLFTLATLVINRINGDD